MPASRIRADHDQLKQVVQTFNRESAAVKRSLDRLRSRMDALQRGDWVGQGANKFYQEMDSAVLPAVERLRAALDQGARTVRQVSHLIDEAEAEAARQQFIEQNAAENYRDEANSQFHEAQIRHEIQQATGTDIGISGEKSAEYARIYQDFSEGNLTRRQAIDQMATVIPDDITGTTGETYREYYSKTYADWWDRYEAPRRENR